MELALWMILMSNTIRGGRNALACVLFGEYFWWGVQLGND